VGPLQRGERVEETSEAGLTRFLMRCACGAPLVIVLLLTCPLAANALWPKPAGVIDRSPGQPCVLDADFNITLPSAVKEHSPLLTRATVRYLRMLKVAANGGSSIHRTPAPCFE
jgi:hypothetical protein